MILSVNLFLFFLNSFVFVGIVFVNECSSFAFEVGLYYFIKLLQLVLFLFAALIKSKGT